MTRAISTPMLRRPKAAWPGTGQPPPVLRRFRRFWCADFEDYRECREGGVES